MDTYSVDGVLAGVVMWLGEMGVTVAGSNSNRERMPSYDGPFFPKEPGPVSTIFQLRAAEIDGAIQRAVGQEP